MRQPIRSSNDAKSAITVQNLSVRFKMSKRDTLRVIEDLNLEIEEGKFYCLLGPSGCGKSTLLNVLSGLVRQNQGEVLLWGQPIAEFKDWSRIGYVFQDDRLLPWRTAVKNVEFGLEARRVAKKERRRRALESLRIVGLEGFEHVFPYQLSGGMRSRVGLARALSIEPAILLMDEPFGALDAQTRITLQNELLSIWEMTKKTIVFVTHDVFEAIYLGDYVAVFSRKPAAIKELIKIDAKRPRDYKSTEILNYYARLSKLLEL